MRRRAVSLWKRSFSAVIKEHVILIVHNEMKSVYRIYYIHLSVSAVCFFCQPKLGSQYAVYTVLGHNARLNLPQSRASLVMVMA